MKPDQQRIAIAGACGWKVYTNHGAAMGKFYCHPDSGIAHHICELPDFLNSLDAMHEAEKVLRHDKRLNYPAYLFDVVCRTSDHWQAVFNRIHPDAWAIQATAAQRAEAFLKTLSLWKDDK